MIKFLMLLLLLAGWSGICNASGITIPVMVTDTLPAKKLADEKPLKEKGNAQAKTVKAVPKAKNQVRPKAIGVKPVKMKPIKVIKPKINGKGFGK
ncbi:hypothetical protein ACTJIJ_05945 [Niabella sp. 22666]|uniref:hypothetical protein n=1 Tax=Niabella sp. 22666 TaxID=3453954 RepID=UPI003F87BC6A